MFSDKITQSIAEAAKQCMDEELKGNQHKIEANKNGKIDADDFKKLRKEETIDETKYEPAEPDADAIAKKKAREEAQRRREEKAERDADDLSKDYKPKTVTKTTTKVAGRAYGGAKQKDIEEEVEQIDETPVTKAKAPYRPGSIDPATGKTREAPKGTYAYDKAQRKKLKESFSGLLESFMTGGIKSLFENLQTVEEEASEEEFNAELKKQKDKAEGKAPQADVAAAATQGTKDMKEEVEELDERELTSAETTEKERIVKGMKKGIEGFKQRYGEQGVAEGAKWRNHPDAHDINDDGDIYPKTRDMFAYDPLTRRQSTAGDARTARGKKSALKTSLKMAQGRHGPKSQLPEQQGVAEKD